jgi:hypothetical protein
MRNINFSNGTRRSFHDERPAGVYESSDVLTEQTPSVRH